MRKRMIIVVLVGALGPKPAAGRGRGLRDAR